MQRENKCNDCAIKRHCCPALLMANLTPKDRESLCSKTIVRKEVDTK